MKLIVPYPRCGFYLKYAYPLEWLCRTFRGHKLTKKEQNPYPENWEYFRWECSCGHDEWRHE